MKKLYESKKTRKSPFKRRLSDFLPTLFSGIPVFLGLKKPKEDILQNEIKEESPIVDISKELTQISVSIEAFSKLFDKEYALTKEGEMIDFLTNAIEKFKEGVSPSFESAMIKDKTMENDLRKYYNFFILDFPDSFKKKVDVANGFSLEPNDLDELRSEILSKLDEFDKEFSSKNKIIQ